MVTAKTQQYIEAVGRRKSATARVRLTKNKKGGFVVNDTALDDYFKSSTQKETAGEALSLAEKEGVYAISVKVKGGGLSAQSEAVRHGISRALIKEEPTLRGLLKKEGYLKRDPRSKERRKFGLKKARKASQWSKR